MLVPATRKRKASIALVQPARKRARQGDYQRGRELLKPQLGIELKAFDVAYTSTVSNTIAAPPPFYCLNAVTNGSELYQRVGRKIYMKSLHFRGAFQPNAAANEQVGRVIIYYDSQPNAAAPTVAALIQDSNAAAASTVFSEINLINRQRFKILRDYQVLLGGVNAVAATVEVVPDPIKNSLNVDFFIKLKGLETIFNAVNGGTIADISSGSIGMVFFGDAAADLHWQLNWQSRLRYYD